MPSWKKVITSGSNAELNQITASKGIAIPQDEKLFFGFDEDAQSFIRESGNDLLIHADDDIILEPDDAFYIRVGGVFKTQFNDGRLGIGGDFTNIPPKPLTVDGDISSSGDFIGEGNISGSSTSTG